MFGESVKKRLSELKERIAENNRIVQAYSADTIEIERKLFCAVKEMQALFKTKKPVKKLKYRRG